MKKIVLLLLIMVASNKIYSQNIISGVIKDTETNISISDASIYFPELEKGVISDEKGEFEIKNIPDGSYKIVVSYLGYSSFTTTLLFPYKEILEVYLTPSAIEIEEVIVSTPFHKLQSDNVVKVERKGIAEIKSNGALTLADGIQSIAGVSNISTGMGIGKPVIRGLSSNRILVYTQGIRLENQQFGGEHGLGVNDSGVESIEVIKGPASLLYGSDALGGVLYINPERFAPQGETKTNVSLNYFTNTSGWNSQAGVKTSSSHLKFLARGSYTTHQDYTTGGDLSVTNTRFKEYDLKTGLGYQNNNFKTELRYTYTRSDLGIPEEILPASNERKPLQPFQELNTHILSNKTSFFMDRSSLDITLGYTANDRKEFEEHHEEEEEEEGVHEEEGPALHMKLRTLSYNLLYHLPKNETIETVLGIQGMYQTNDNFGEELLIPDAVTSDIGLYVTSHLHFNKNDIQLGLRYDRRNIDSEIYGITSGENFIAALDKSFNSFNAALGLKTEIAKRLISRINLATGFRAPNLAELTSNGGHEGANRFEIGNPDLSEEKNIQIDLALEYQNEHVELFVNGFYNRINDYIFLNPNGEIRDEDPVYLYQQNDAKLFGGEAGIHIHPHPLDWLHWESSFELVNGKQNKGEYLPLIPANSLTNTLRVEFNKADKKLKNLYAFTSLQSVFSKNKIGDFETPTDGYNLLNLGFGSNITFGKQFLKFRVAVNNAFDKNYISHLSRLKPDGINNIGRNINIGIDFLF